MSLSRRHSPPPAAPGPRTAAGRAARGWPAGSRLEPRPSRPRGRRTLPGVRPILLPRVRDRTRRTRVVRGVPPVAGCGSVRRDSAATTPSTSAAAAVDSDTATPRSAVRSACTDGTSPRRRSLNAVAVAAAGAAGGRATLAGTSNEMLSIEPWPDVSDATSVVACGSRGAHAVGRRTWGHATLGASPKNNELEENERKVYAVTGGGWWTALAALANGTALRLLKRRLQRHTHTQPLHARAHTLEAS